MTVEIQLTASARKEFHGLPVVVQKRFRTAMEDLRADWPVVRRARVKALQGRPKLWRLRVGDYRAFFEVEGTTLVFTRFGHRSTVYRA